MRGHDKPNPHILVSGPFFSRRMHVPTMTAILGLAFGTLCLTLFAILAGSQSIHLRDAFDLVVDPGRLSDQTMRILWDLRLPRVFLALMVGAMLGLAGTAMQTLTRNGLADPGLLGVKEGASAAAIVFSLYAPSAGLYGRTAAGMAGGLAISLTVVLIARGVTRMRFVMVGIGMSWLAAAVVSVIVTTADIRDVQAALVWLAGSLNGASWEAVPIGFAAMCIGACLLFLTAGSADAAMLGPQAAAGLGVSLKTFALIRFTAPVLLTAASVSLVGSLGFVGLIAPHLARLTVPGSQSPLLGASALYGAALVLAADTIGRAAFAPHQLPAGIVMSIVGVPVLLTLLWKRRDQL